jgi:hypothetical protein
MVIMVWSCLTGVGDLTNVTGIRSNPLVFPFLSSSPVTQLILLAGALFLFADAPFISKDQPYLIIRSKRISWALGHVLFVVAASAIYFLILMFSSVLIMLPHSTFATDGWGRIINTLAQTDAGAQAGLSFSVQEKITAYYSPFGAFSLCFLLNTCAASFLGLLVFTVSIKFNRMVGLIAGAMVIYLDLLTINALPYSFYWYSPVTLSRLDVLDPTGVSRYPDTAYPFIFYGAGILLMTVILLLLVRKSPVKVTSEL